MTPHKTPGVYIKQISKLPPSIAAVETCIPVFIGYTEKHKDPKGKELKNVAHRITSPADFEACYGVGIPETLEIDLLQEVSAVGEVLSSTVNVAGSANRIPGAFLHYAMQLYFANGGGRCYVISIGQKPSVPSKDEFLKAIKLLDDLDEPALVAIPDVCLFPANQYGDIVDMAVNQCESDGNKFLILDVLDGYTGGNDTSATINTEFRLRISSATNLLKHAAAYFPYLETNLPSVIDDNAILIVDHLVKTKSISGVVNSSIGAFKGKTLDQTDLKTEVPAVYSDIKAQINRLPVTIPPSGAVLGAIVSNDNRRGVWKAPANIALNNVLRPSIAISNSFQSQLNIHSSGKSINAIRTFSGRGILIWGARTLAGNDNEWRYIPTVRFYMFAKESIEKGTKQFVFEPNDANTWLKVKATIENFLYTQWKNGALLGSKPEDAYFVQVGLGATMTSIDIQEGRMIIEIGMALLRPAEFIVLRIYHKMSH